MKKAPTDTGNIILDEHNARYAECETMDDCWREYLGDDYDNEDALQLRGTIAQNRRWR